MVFWTARARFSAALTFGDLAFLTGRANLVRGEVVGSAERGSEDNMLERRVI
jgi:hypothetical protein